MMTSSNGNIFRVTGHLYREFTGHRWIPLHKGQWCGTLVFSMIWARTNGWVNNRGAGDLRCHRAHYDVIVMANTLRRTFNYCSANAKKQLLSSKRGCLYFCHMWHYDVMKLKHFLRNWPFVRGIHRSPVNSPHKEPVTRALVFSLMLAETNGCKNNRGQVIWNAMMVIVTSL